MKYIISFALGFLATYYLETSTFNPEVSKETPYLLYIAGGLSFLFAYLGFKGLKAIYKELQCEKEL